MTWLLLVPLALLALSIPLTAWAKRWADEQTRPPHCNHPWYIDKRCIVCGTPR